MLKYRELLTELQKLSDEQLEKYIIISGEDQHQIGCELVIAQDDLYENGRYTRKEIENIRGEYINGISKKVWLEEFRTFKKGTIFIKTIINYEEFAKFR